MTDLTPEKRQEIIDMLLKGCETLAAKKKQCEMLQVPFEWPSIKDQIFGKGHKGGVKRGRAKYERDMFIIPGFEIEGFNPFPGFVCHPSAAVAAAEELLRLAKEHGISGE